MATRLLEVAPGSFDEAAYQRKIDELLSQVGRLDRRAQRTTLELLGELRRQVAEKIPNVSQLTRPAYLRAMRSIDEAIRRFVERYRVDVAELQRQGFDLGVALAQAPLVAGGIAIGVTALTDELVDQAAATSADLIRNIGGDLRRRINSELLSAVLGTQTPQDAVRNIGHNLRDPNHFRTIGARAQAIVVTEIGRIHQVATQARLAELVETVPGLKKRWLHSHVGQARQAHLEAEARYRPDGSVGPIDIDATYEINGHRARFPKDATLPASETVHCRCVSVPVPPEELSPTRIVLASQPEPGRPLTWTDTTALATMPKARRRQFDAGLAQLTTWLARWPGVTDWARRVMGEVKEWRFLTTSQRFDIDVYGVTAAPDGPTMAKNIGVGLTTQRNNEAWEQWRNDAFFAVAQHHAAATSLLDLQARMKIWRDAHPQPRFFREANPTEIAATVIHELGHVADFASDLRLSQKLIDDGIFAEWLGLYSAGDHVLGYGAQNAPEALGELIRLALVGDVGQPSATGLTADEFRLAHPHWITWLNDVVLAIKP